MLTYQLVQPSFALFKLASIFGAIPYKVSVSTGKLEPKRSTAAALRIYRVLQVLKIIQLSISILNLSNFLQQSSRGLQNILTVILLLVVVVVALVWSFEFEKHHVEVVILLSPLGKVGEADKKTCGEAGCFPHVEIPNGKTNFIKRKLCQLVRAYARVPSYLRTFYKEFRRLMPTFSIYDILTIIVPVAIPSIICLAYLCAIVGEPEDAFILSLLNAEARKILPLRAATVLFDLTVFTFVGGTVQFAFYTLCAVLAINILELKRLERFIDNNGMETSQSLSYVWQEIRRLETIFNLFNNLCSNCFYLGKIMAFACSVLGSFYVLKFGITNLASVAVALLGLEAIMFYLLCLGNAYVITETMNSILQKVRFRSQYHVGTISRRELQQRIKSVRPVALQEAGFRGMSRETTPEFVEFYVNQVIALVLAF